MLNSVNAITGRRPVQWRCLCFSSLSLWWLPCGANKGFKLAGPNLASYPWTGMYVWCLCVYVFDLQPNHLQTWFTDIKYISQNRPKLHRCPQLHQQQARPKSAMLNLKQMTPFSILSLSTGLNPELSSVRFLRCTRTN